MTDQRTIIKKAIEYLSGVCDFAQTKDGHGFNKPDAYFGHSLNFVQWDDDIEAAALDMLQKYRSQLESVHIDLPKLSENTNGNSARVRQLTLELTRGARKSDVMDKNTKLGKVDVDGDRLMIYFPGKPSDEARNAIKSIQGWRWLPDLSGMPWSIPLANFANLRKALPDINWTEAAIKATMTTKEQPVEQSVTQAKSPVSIKLENGKLAIRFAYGCSNFEQLLATVKALSDRKYDKTRKTWDAPTRILTEVLAAFPDAEYNGEIKALLETQKQLIAKSNQVHSDFKVAGLGGELMSFQAAGVEFVTLANGRALIADQMGLGKTIQAIAYLQHEPTKRPAVIVVPASLKINWQREINKWLTTKDRVAILIGTKPHDLELESASIFVINYDILYAWVDAIKAIKPQILISDESHLCKHKSSRRSKAVASLTKTIPNVLFLTGTPVTNRPLELFTLLNMLNPKEWGNFWQYVNRYCGATNNGFGWDFSGSSNLEELHQKIKTIVIRRTKDQVLKELPAKVRIPIALEISKADRKAYEQAQADAEDRVAHGEPGAHLAIIESLKQAAAQAKMKPAIEWIENFLDSDEKLVVFATHIKVIDELMDYFGEHAVRVTGEVSMKDRQVAVDRFQNDDSIRLFVGNTQAAGIGLTLTAASNVCFLEYPWTPADLEQASDRVHRIGQTDSVTIWYLAAAYTIDEDIIKLLDKKSRIVDTIQDGNGQPNINILSELIQLLRKETGN